MPEPRPLQLPESLGRKLSDLLHGVQIVRTGLEVNVRAGCSHDPVELLQVVQVQLHRVEAATLVGGLAAYRHELQATGRSQACN